MDSATEAIVLGLFGISNHDNMGGIFRNAAAFGVDAVLIDGACCDPLYRKAIRVSVGGVLIVPFARIAVGEDAIGMLEAKGFSIAALSPDGGTDLRDYQDIAPRGPAAWDRRRPGPAERDPGPGRNRFDRHGRSMGLPQRCDDERDRAASFAHAPRPVIRFPDPVRSQPE